MLSPGMVGFFPPGVNDRPLSDFNDAVARLKADGDSCQNYLHMGPLITVIMNIVGNLAEENAFRF